MTDQTTQSIVIKAPASRVMDAIANFADYPSWVSAAKSVEVLSTGANGRGEHVRFMLDAGIVKDTYELMYTWADDGTKVSWKLVKGQMQKAQTGSYTLEEVAGGTKVTYQLTVDINIPMIGLFKRKAEKVITDTALKELKKKVED